MPSRPCQAVRTDGFSKVLTTHNSELATGYCVKFTVAVMITGTGTPFSNVGS